MVRKNKIKLFERIQNLKKVLENKKKLSQQGKRSSTGASVGSRRGLKREKTKIRSDVYRWYDVDVDEYEPGKYEIVDEEDSGRTYRFGRDISVDVLEDQLKQDGGIPNDADVYLEADDYDGPSEYIVYDSRTDKPLGKLVLEPFDYEGDDSDLQFSDDSMNYDYKDLDDEEGLEESNRGRYYKRPRNRRP